jgi:hypothetical protein
MAQHCNQPPQGSFSRRVRSVLRRQLPAIWGPASPIPSVGVWPAARGGNSPVTDWQRLTRVGVN